MDESRGTPIYQELEDQLEIFFNSTQASQTFINGLEQKMLSALERSHRQQNKNRPPFLAWVKPTLPVLVGSGAVILFAVVLIWSISRLVTSPENSSGIPAAIQTDELQTQRVENPGQTETPVMELTSTSSSLSTTGDFGIYLLIGETKVSDIFIPGMDIESLPLQEEPIIASPDIVAYDPETHEMEITSEAAQRLGNLQIPLDGLPFVVCVGAERIYAGAFWTSLSSVSFSDGVVIDATFPEETKTLRFQLGYPESSNTYRGEDLRGDVSILEALRQAGIIE